MAPLSSSRKKGKKKVSVESVDAVSEDRICNSPDSILCFILSFLPTLHSIRTSLLSKRWKLLWTQVPTVRFNANLPSLLEAYIDVNDVYATKEAGIISYSNSVTKLVQDVQHASSLTVTHHTIKHGEVLEKIDLYVANNHNIKAHLEMAKRVSVFCRLSPSFKVHLLKRNSGSCKKLMIRPLNAIPFDC
ncbi:hypothetical protein M9H77_22179 [Catharanthus roseus]|uniref:Uncharacterized protein n=1 Tax=Catharanthus roseus TaxID=4058 RepID=A0ACC0AQF5_CATRO|nr:hypothetical protein M9H77_22179 [Catharanthus roseus]